MPGENTPSDGGKSIQDALFGAREFYDRTSRTRRVRRATRFAEGGISHFYDVSKSEFLRAEFTAWLDSVLETFVGSWIELKAVIPHLLALACDAEVWTNDWRAPGWTVNLTKRGPGSMVPERLDAGGTKAVVAELRAYAKRRLSQNQFGASANWKGSTEKLPPIKVRMSKYRETIDAARLTARQRQAFLFHLERRMSFAEIAKHMGVDKKTAYEHFVAAKQKLEAQKLRKST